MGIRAFALGLSIIVLSSCGSKKDVVYFQNASAFETIVSNNSNVNRYKVDDVVGINVSTLDPQASVPFNIIRGTQEGGMRPEQLDYIVDKNGDIDFPVLGSVKLLGLSPSEAKILLTERLKDYLKDPIINIRLRNFSVTILGAVNRPGTYSVNGEQITILEALGLAGDLNIKGIRDNVMVIRDFNGTKVYTRIDLTTKNALNSSVYYLTQNDVVYVEPNKSLISSATLDNRSSIAISIASILITTTVILITRN
jgi:polysaccharide export outer membrane protein